MLDSNDVPHHCLYLRIFLPYYRRCCYCQEPGKVKQLYILSNDDLRKGNFDMTQTGCRVLILSQPPRLSPRLSPNATEDCFPSSSPDSSPTCLPVSNAIPPKYVLFGSRDLVSAIHHFG